MATHKQIAANRANAKRSTGPKTNGGKARSRLNATRHGLTGQVLVVTGEDHAAYRAHCDAFLAEFAPKSYLESQFVQQMADIRWRLNRVVSIENNLCSLTGFRSEFQTGNEQVDRALGQAEAFAAQIPSMATLTLYEQRLLRQFKEADEQRLEAMWRHDRRVREEAAAVAKAEADAKAVVKAAEKGAAAAEAKRENEERRRIAAGPWPPPQRAEFAAPSPAIGFVSSTPAEPREAPPQEPLQILPAPPFVPSDARTGPKTNSGQ